MKRVRIAVVLFAAASSTAQANPGCIYTDFYLFTNPSYLGGLIGTIPAPAPVEVVRKGRKWSIVSYDGKSGYVKTSHLSPFWRAPRSAAGRLRPVRRGAVSRLLVEPEQLSGLHVQLDEPNQLELGQLHSRGRSFLVGLRRPLRPFWIGRLDVPHEGAVGGGGDSAHAGDIEVIQNFREGDLGVEHDQPSCAVLRITTVIAGAKARAACT